MVVSLSACSQCSSSKVAESPKIDEPLVLSEGDGYKTLQIGAVKVTWIQDNEGNQMNPSSLFDAPQSLIDSLALQDGIPAAMSAFLVEVDSLRILFDTGLGAPHSRLNSTLSALGVQPQDLSYIVLSHFHGDHIGGLLVNNELQFPNAAVYAPKLEYDAWMQMPENKNERQRKTMAAYQPQLRFFAYGDTLLHHVLAIDAHGHTPGHTVFQVGQLLIISDLVHGWALQKNYPEYCARYDMDKQTAVEARRRILQYAKDNHLVMAGMHISGGFTE